MSAAADRANKCFALARSTTHPGEREAAINRGLRILDRAGLDPDNFNVPGRVKRYTGTQQFGTSTATSPRPFYGDVATGANSEFLRAFSDAMSRSAATNAKAKGSADALRAFSDALRSGVVSGDDMNDILGKLRRD